jgi:ubiquinone biosynthesis protein Coq4
MQQFTFDEFYTDKINDLTLGEALEMHYQLNPQFTRWDKYPTKLQQETMKSHDIMHVVFGCDTDLPGEFRVELLTFFCVNLSFDQYVKMASNNEINKEPFEIVKRIGYLKVFWVMLIHIWYIPYSWYRGFKMKKKWPVLETDGLLDKKLGDLRQEYGIKLLHKSRLTT